MGREIVMTTEIAAAIFKTDPYDRTPGESRVINRTY
jgi:hypothetical protein